jgi:hypothetical protein
MPSDTSETGGLDPPEIKRSGSICDRIIGPKLTMSEINKPSKWTLIELDKEALRLLEPPVSVLENSRISFLGSGCSSNNSSKQDNLNK